MLALMLPAPFPGNAGVALGNGIVCAGVVSLLPTATPAIVVADAAAAAAAAAADDAVIRLQESSLCHLELLCSAALICVQSSFLHDLELQARNGMSHLFSKLKTGINSPLDRLQPILELCTALLCDLECGACGYHNAGKLLVITLRQMIQLLVYALNVPIK